MKADTKIAAPMCRQELSDQNFVCERVCTSDRLLRRMGGLSKVAAREIPSYTRMLQVACEVNVCLTHFTPMQDPTPNTCVTVCGTSSKLPSSTLSVTDFRYCGLAFEGFEDWKALTYVHNVRASKLGHVY